MAVIKHIASKNADYGESERYLIFQHNEYTQKPILDDEGHMILREEYYLDGLNCDPFPSISYPVVSMESLVSEEFLIVRNSGSKCFHSSRTR